MRRGWRNARATARCGGCGWPRRCCWRCPPDRGRPCPRCFRDPPAAWAGPPDRGPPHPAVQPVRRAAANAGYVLAAVSANSEQLNEVYQVAGSYAAIPAVRLRRDASLGTCAVLLCRGARPPPDAVDAGTGVVPVDDLLQVGTGDALQHRG